MIHNFASFIADGSASAAAAHVLTVAAPIWDIGANVKNQGISFAVFLLMGGTAVLAVFEYFVVKNKTAALKTVAVGVILIGIIGALPSLGVVSKDTVHGLTNSGTR
ncbi:hypothetical protein [Mycobacterium sp. 1245852.3]|uniref:hypothetical protein n=1 Tax=Mycobacterium sp. 1245852.3 TaxID=1856860 RepID=UPI0008024B83|nr:hypothetical protein [Mycobacterium sp. 1245852.3]OBK04908.1 hypothetical protein A9W96_14750 [Mycobacterium sp. 1245852.3]